MRKAVTLLLLPLAALGLACASDSDADKPPVQAEVCHEGERSLFIYNHNDFEWRDIRFYLTTGADGITYERSWVNWFPEAQQPTEPRANPESWEEPEDGIALHDFRDVTQARITINQPHEAEWSGPVTACP